MSRVAVYQTLANSNDPALAGVGIWPNYVMDTPPSRTEPFIILRWGNQEIRNGRGAARGPRILDVWLHIPVQKSQDHADIDVMLDAVRRELTGLVDRHVVHIDGYRVTDVRFTGAGADFKDPGYDTITRNATFEILSSRVE